jgi:xanthine/CO dehydrogenase XdhC/CoxF family maturation factor
MLLVHSYKKNVSAVAGHLQWPEVKVQAAVNYARAFPEEINEAMAENEATDFEALKRMLPQAADILGLVASSKYHYSRLTTREMRATRILRDPGRKP